MDETQTTRIERMVADAENSSAKKKLQISGDHNHLRHLRSVFAFISASTIVKSVRSSTSNDFHFSIS